MTVLKRLREAGQTLTETDLKRLLSVYKANLQAAAEYVLEKISVPIIFLRASERESDYDFLPDAATIAADPTWG